MNRGDERKGVIGIGTAIGLFALLAVWSVLTLRGLALAFALIIIVGLAIKSYVHFLRGRIQ